MIEAVGLSKKYGGTTAVSDLSFQVQPGVVTGFLGPNGSGKSTTMRMLLGLDHPTAGRALIDGKPYGSLRRPLTRVGALLDAKWVHPNRSARSHLRWMAASNGLSRQRVDEVLELVGLTSVADRRAGEFSLGMSQRLGIAGALLGDPEILLFDEPVNGLDPEGIQWIRGLMHDLADEGRTVFVSSHLMAEMALTATQLVVIGRGRLIAQTGVDDFIAASTESVVRVAADDNSALAAALDRAALRWSPAGGDALDVHDAAARDVGRIAAGAGLVLFELVQQRASLEEAFLLLTADAADYAAGDRAHLTGRTATGTAVPSPTRSTIAAGDPAGR